MTGFCEHGNKLLASTTSANFLTTRETTDFSRNTMHHGFQSSSRQQGTWTRWHQSILFTRTECIESVPGMLFLGFNTGTNWNRLTAICRVKYYRKWWSDSLYTIRSSKLEPQFWLCGIRTTRRQICKFVCLTIVSAKNLGFQLYHIDGPSWPQIYNHMTCATTINPSKLKLI